MKEVQKVNGTYLAEIPAESGEVVAMCELNKAIFIATKKGHIYAYRYYDDGYSQGRYVNEGELVQVMPE